MGFERIRKGGHELNRVLEQKSNQITGQNRASGGEAGCVRMTQGVCFLAVTHGKEQGDQIRKVMLLFKILHFLSFCSFKIWNNGFPRSHPAISIGPLSKDVLPGVLLITGWMEVWKDHKFECRKYLWCRRLLKAPMIPLTFSPSQQIFHRATEIISRNYAIQSSSTATFTFSFCSFLSLACAL